MICKKDLKIRWMVKSDFYDVVHIDSLSYSFFWDYKKIFSIMTKNNSLGLVAEKNGIIIAYLIYESKMKSFSCSRLAVHPDHRRKGIGSDILNSIIFRMKKNKINKIDFLINEYNLEAQLFLKYNEFKAIDIIKNKYSDVKEDAYLMRIVNYELIPAHHSTHV